MIFMFGSLTLFIGWLFIVGMRPFGVGEFGFVRTLWSGLIGGCVLIWFLPLPFCAVTLVLLLVGLGCGWASPDRIDEEFRKAWLPYFCRSGQREASLEEFNEEVVGWLPLLPEVHLPPLTGNDLFQVVRGKTATAGSLDGWGWRELKVLPVSWYDELARILTKVEDLGVWPDGLLDAYISMIPKTDGNAPLGQRPLRLL